MLDNYGASVERILKIQNSNIYKTSATSKVKDNFEEDKEKNQSFKKSIEKVIKKKDSIETEGEKVSIGNSVEVEQSLSNRIRQQKLIAKLVEEKFVNNPYFKDKILFNDDKSLEDRIYDLLNDEEYEEIKDEEVKKSVRDELLEELEKTINNLNKNNS